MANNNQIDNTSYYRLPCGKQLEDFIFAHDYDFFWGSAIKYAYRAGAKDGESREKDLAKKMHYVRFIAKESGETERKIEQCVDCAVSSAIEWKGGVK